MMTEGLVITIGAYDKVYGRYEDIGPGHYHQTQRLKPSYPRLLGTSLNRGPWVLPKDGHRGGSCYKFPTGVAEMEGEGCGCGDV